MDTQTDRQTEGHWHRVKPTFVSGGLITGTSHAKGLRLYHGCSGLVVEYWTRNREAAGSTHTRSTASNLEQVANVLCAQANSASYPQRDGK